MEEEKKLYNIYIDESGDEGINKGSKYFIITAIIVSIEKDPLIANKIRNIKNELEIGNKQLHWNRIKGFPNKKYIISELSTEDFTIIHVVVDTHSINYIKSNNIYFTYFNYLLERIFLYIRNNGKIKNLNISSRSGLSCKKIRDNIENRYDNIDLNKLSRIKIIDNKKLQLLQLADVCSSSFHQSIKYNDENTNQFFYILKPKLFTSLKNKILGYGIKLVPNNGSFDNILSKL